MFFILSMRMKNDQASSLIIFASFIEDEKITIKNITFDPKALRFLEREVKEQIAELTKLKEIEFDSRYKLENNEIFSVPSYQDTDKTIDKLKSAISVGGYDNILEVSELDNSLGLFFVFRSEPTKFYFQKFTKRMMIKKDTAFLKMRSNDIFGLAEEDQFTLGPKLTGYFDCSVNNLYISSIYTAKQIFPKFLDSYVQEATPKEMEDFFKDSIFDSTSVENIPLSSVKIARLVWLINNEKIQIGDRLKDLEDISGALNMQCITIERKIKMFKEVIKSQYVLQIILKDIFRDGAKIYLANSKRIIKPFLS